jgi:hypothetical protein
MVLCEDRGYNRHTYTTYFTRGEVGCEKLE